MYEAFFGLRERPFQLTPNPRYLFLNAGHREALATLRYGLSSALGITLLLGEAGTGKTTLLQAALQAEGKPEHRLAALSNPTLSVAEFFEVLADRLGLPDPGGSKGRFLIAFERDLRERDAAGGLTAVVVDEAQSLTHAVFEELRLLANLETATRKLVNVVLVGQPELAVRLNDASLRQFKQRIVLRCSLEPLDLDSMAAYVAARLHVAGADASDVFTKDAIRVIHEASRGIPRTIGVVCENALLAGFAAQRKPIDGPMVIEVCRDLVLPVTAARLHGVGRGSDRPVLAVRRSPLWTGGEGSAEPVDPPSEPAAVTTGSRILGLFKGMRPMRTFMAAMIAFALSGQGTAPGQTPSPRPQRPAAGSPATGGSAGGADVTIEPGFRIGPEDVLGILFWRDQEMSGDVTVRPDGMVTLPLVRDVRAAGLTPDELADRIQEAAREFITDASVTVVVRQVNSRKVFITGEVARPGAYPLASSMTVMQLIAIAGGLTEFAEPKSISIMRLENGESRTFDFDYRDVARGRKRQQNILLAPGDTVVVPET